MILVSRRARRRLLDLLLLPIALLVVLFEDVLWRGATQALRQLGKWPPVERLESRLAALPGWAALPLFLIPETLGRLGEFWALALMVRGHATSGITLYIVVRVVATLLIVFVYHACEPALLTIGWFATCVRWAGILRDWALGLVRPLRDRIRAVMRTAPGLLARRFAALRRRLRRARPASR